MAARNELVIRGNAVGLDTTLYPNDSKLESKIVFLESNGTTYTATLGSCVFTTAGADVADGDTIQIGNRTYTFKTALTGVKATGLLTSDATAPSDGDTVTIQGYTYTFRTTLSSPVQLFEVAIGASAAAALDNIKQAINQGDSAYPTAASNEGRGSNWSTGTYRHPYVTATTNTNTVQTVQAREYGVAANKFSLVETSSHLAWGASTMGTVVTSEVAGVANVLDQILIQVSAAVTLDILKDVINGTALVGVAGTDWSDGTAAHTQVTATTNTNTAQTVVARNAAFDNAKIATVMTGGGNMAAGTATLASGVRGVTAVVTGATTGSAGISGGVNHI